MVFIKGDLCNAIEMIFTAVRIEAMEFVFDCIQSYKMALRMVYIHRYNNEKNTGIMHIMHHKS